MITRGSGGTTAARSKQLLGLPGSRRTVARAINSLGFRSVARRAKGVLTESARVLRLAFAVAMLPLTVAQWAAKVHFCIDVKTFQYSRYPTQWGNSTQRRVYRRAGESALTHGLTRHSRSITTGCRGVKLLAGLSWGGAACSATLAAVFHSRWNSQTFIAMIPILVASLYEAYPSGPGPGGYWYVLMDNDPVFRAGAVVAALETNKIRRPDFGLPWPANFQDCNIIENSFSECMRRLANAPPGLESRVQFESRVRSTFLGLESSYISSLVHSMPRRMLNVRNLNGAMTKY